MKRKITLLFIVAMFVLPGLTKAQQIGDLLAKYTDVNGKQYMQPFADVFGANLNSGVYSSAYIRPTGFSFNLSFVGMVAFIPESKKTFMAVPTDDAFGTNEVKTPTIFGPSDGGLVESEYGTTYRFPGGFDIDYVPLVVPQITIGSLYGTDFSVRYLATETTDDVGKLDYYGLGIRHNLSQYIENLPFDLAVGYFFQKFKLGDIVDASSSIITGQISVNKSIFTLYGGLGYEISHFKIEYDFDDGTNFIFDANGKNSVRLTLGARMNMGPVRLNVDYSLANQSVLSAGLGFGFGDRGPKKPKAEDQVQTQQ